MIGHASVGKTSLISRLTDETFHANVFPTISANFRIYSQEVDNHIIELQIWDTAGQERYRALSPIYYRNAHAAVAVFGLDSAATMNELPEVVNVFWGVAATALVFVAANKADLEEMREISQTVASDFVKKHKWPLFFTSAKTGAGVRELFDDVCRQLARTQIDREITNPLERGHTMNECC
jgi:small GTP-binding protein